MALAGGAGVWALWRLFVLERAGRLVDGTALEGAGLGRNRLWWLAEPVLDVISIPFIAAAVVTAAVVAVLRRRVLLAVQVVMVVGGANLSTQVLKETLLGRPDLDLSDRLANTLPSGHTTAAASCSVALVLAAPHRIRVPVAVAAVIYTTWTGVSTLVGGWHRPSDVVAALLVVLAWVGLAWIVAPAVTAGRRDDRRRDTAAGSLLIAGALVAAAISALALQRTYRTVVEIGGTPEARVDLLTAYGGGAAGVVAATALIFGLLLLLLRVGRSDRGLDLRP